MQMKTRVSKWGNSLGIRIPQVAAIEIGIEEGSEVEITIEENRLIIKKMPSYSLEELLSAIKKDNLHGEIHFGDRTGEEAW